jgi:type IV secretion system protein VirB6
MITANTFFSGTLNTVDAVIGNFVSTAYANFIQANSGMITLLFTLYVMLLGYQFVTHSSPFHLGSITRHLVIMLCVYGMVMNWQLYNQFVYRIFTIEPSNIAQILVNSIEKTSTVKSIAEVLDNIYLIIIDITAGFFGQISFSSAGIAFILYGLLVYTIGMAMCVFALLLFIYAKMMMAISLALGPLFILFILWNPTKPLFSAWLNKLMTIALIPIITSAILVLMLSVIVVTLPKVNLPVENLQFYGITPFLGLSLTTTLILSQVFRICGMLAGGITLASISSGMQIADSVFQKTGAKFLAQKAANVAMNKTRKMLRRRKKL